MYLHVEDSNEAALAMYLSMEYQLTPGLSKFQNKLMGMESIQYYKKSLKVSTMYDDDGNDENRNNDKSEDGFISGLLSDLDAKIGSSIMKSKGKY